MNDVPAFLATDQVLEIHAYQIQHHGGDAGVRDFSLLDSALAMPRQAFGGEFVHADLAAMAAAYLFHIVKNHPFADGNKRTGMHTAIVFLTLNGCDFDIPTDEAEALTLAVATGHASKEEAAAFFRKLLADSAQ
jgi:death-on-curing protein